MNNRIKELLLPLLAASPAAAAQAQPDADHPQNSRPNLVIIYADDLGYGDLSCYGAHRVSTPNTDRIAGEGIRFTDAHAVASTSTPSRFSLLTGIYAFRQEGTGVAQGDAASIIHPDTYTLADMFSQAGYATAAIGKWHLGLGSESGAQDWNGELDITPADLGFGTHYIMAATADRTPCVFIENGRIADFDPSAPVEVSYKGPFEDVPDYHRTPVSELKLRSSNGHDNAVVNGIGRIGYMKGGGKALWKDENIADSITAHAVEFILEHSDGPFFLYFATNDVHVPRMPHERFRGKSPMGLRGEAILQFDYSVGQILDALEQAGIRDNTIIILTSDNGPVLDDGYADSAAELVGDHSITGGLRGSKYSAFERRPPRQQVQRLRRRHPHSRRHLLARTDNTAFCVRRPHFPDRPVPFPRLHHRSRAARRRRSRQPRPLGSASRRRHYRPRLDSRMVLHPLSPYPRVEIHRSQRLPQIPFLVPRHRDRH